MDDTITKSIEKNTLSEWLNVIKSAEKPPSAPRLSWAQRVENEVTEEGMPSNSNKVNDPSIISIELDDIQEEIEYWMSAVVCYVLGANPPISVMEGYFKRIWGKHGIDKIAIMGKGVFLVRFSSTEASLKVIHDGFQFFDQKPVIVKLWDPNMEINKADVDVVPIWVKLPGLHFKYWGEKSLFKIVRQIGKAVKMDATTKSKDRLNYARVMIEVGIQGQLPENIQFYNEHGVLVTQTVEYEWRPVQCGKCKGYGHETDKCKKLEGNKRWVKKPIQVTDQEGFIKITTNRVTNEPTTVEVPVHNTFLPLEEEMEIDKGDRGEESNASEAVEITDDVIVLESERLGSKNDPKGGIDDSRKSKEQREEPSNPNG
ncbi:uncharacterized protein LOC104906959 [Beta vulgaris subsp. vulgaris]|uniref:uncharacterized protein LOC104906959 n=1 Tax=Beta vulgaris subsp. vulgaris TaxID=3555 RepID=UPI002036F032|nr:uncharacterized protein LOC104906959 [Beta vulgaris subsp. vulgaris]